VFVGLFRWGLQRFFGEEKPFPSDRTDLKIIARWCYDWCANVQENFQNLKKIGTKFVRTTSKRVERKLLPHHFTPCIVDVHPYLNILLPRYRVPLKTIKFVPVVPKVHGRDNVCAHRKSIKLYNFQKCFKNVLGAFYRG